MVEYRDAKFFAVQIGRIVDPIRALAPHLGHAREAILIDYFAPALLGKIVGQPDSERAFLGVAKRDILGGRERDLEIDGPQSSIRIELHLAALDQQRLALRIAPFDGCFQFARAVAVFEGDVAHDFAPDSPFRIRRVILPKLDAIHVVVGKPEAGVM